MTKLIPHIILFRQFQYLIPEFFYKSDNYELIKHYSFYLFVVFCFIGMLKAQIITKESKILVYLAVLLEVMRALNFEGITIIFTISLILGLIWQVFR